MRCSKKGSYLILMRKKSLFCKSERMQELLYFFFFLTEIAGNLHGPKNADLENMRKCQGSALIVQHITGLNKGDLG